MHRVLALAAIAVAGVGLVACGDSAKTRAAAKAPRPPLAISRGVVDQDGGLIRITAPRDGVIARVLAQEGDAVAAGQALALLDARQSRLVLASAEADVGDRAAQTAIARAKLDAAQRDEGRLRRLAAQDAASHQDADQARTAAQIARAEYDQAVQAQRSAAARRDLERFSVDAGAIRSVTAGRIVRRLTVGGASVAAGAPLFVLEADAPRIVRAEVDESFADKVRPGMPVTVSREFDTTGAAFPAHVLRVSTIFGAAGLNDDPSSRADSRVIAVVVSLDGASTLKLGQRVLVRFAP